MAALYKPLKERLWSAAEEELGLKEVLHNTLQTIVHYCYSTVGH